MFHLWMIIYLVSVLICFTITYTTFFVKKPNQTRKLFGTVTLILGTICILDFLSQVAGPTDQSIYMQKIIIVIYPFATFIAMLIPRTLCMPLKNRTLLKILMFPVMIGLFSISMGGIVTGAEASCLNELIFVKFLYLEDIYSMWIFANFLPVIVFYYYSGKILKSPAVKSNKEVMNRLKIFILAFTVLVVLVFAFGIAEVVFGTPPLSSLSSAIATSLAMVAFKLGNEKM